MERNLQGVNLMIGTPVHSDVAVEYTQSLVKTVQAAQQYGVTIHTFFPGGSCIHQQRNMVLGRFLKDTSLTHLLFIDSDMCFSPESVFNLLVYDKEFSGIAYRAKGEVIGFNIVARNTDQKCPETGMIKVENLAGGFMMLKKSAIQKMVKAYPKLKCLGFPRSMQKDRPEDELNQYYYNLFDWGINEKTNYILSEDFLFCERWRKIGGEIFVDASQELGHVGKKIYSGKLKDNIVNGRSVIIHPITR